MKSKISDQLQTKGMFLKQKMKQWFSLVCLYQHATFLTDLILSASDKKVVNIKLFLLKAVSWTKDDGIQREERDLVVEFIFSLGVLFSSSWRGFLFACCITIYMQVIWVCRGREGGREFLLINPLWQLLCSFSICKLLKKLRIETEKKIIKSSAVIWHPILSLFLMTCPLTFFYNVSDF